MRNVILIFLLASPMFSSGQVDPACFVRKYFLLIQSSSDKNPRIGLSLPADTCIEYSEQEGGDGDSSCYMARGRWDDGVYISIEYSNAYDGFSKGYYIAVVGSSNEKDPALMAALEKVKTKYSDAYIKASKVYMCCMH